MNYLSYVFPVVMMLAFGGYAIWMMQKRGKMIADSGPAMAAFFQRTGFRYADMPPEPLEHHVRRAMQEAESWAPGNRTTHYVRHHRGLALHHVSAFTSSESGYSVSCSWSADLIGPPSIPFHVADRSLCSLGKAVREAFSNTTRVWSAKHPHEVRTGIPAVDQRFVVFGRDPNAVAWLFQQSPALVAAILRCVEVDLWVSDRDATFSDPSQKNVIAAMGGMAGHMALGYDIVKRMELSIPVHEHISDLLALAVHAACPSVPPGFAGAMSPGRPR
ncbi:MAG: hypothetical protein JST00_46695 [Deltaproteobacteria bacterium]|nr:hypothetical protein [Deltaproteobacteria bacterium]